MATAEQPKHMWIPPPPLPEFYLSKEQLEKRKEASSSSGTDVDADEAAKGQAIVQKKKESKSQPPPISGDGAYDGLPPPYRYVGIPPPPPAGVSNDVPPLAVYHICRICLRPRSGRYHRQHPIPVNGVPPPPGICRRCRVTSAEDLSETSDINISDVDEVVKKQRSNEIKIGVIAPFVPDEAIISNSEAKRMEAQRYLRGRSRERHITIYREASSESQRRHRRSKSRRSDIVYRHVRVVKESSERGTKHQPSKPSKAEPAVAHERDYARRYVQYTRDAEQTIVSQPDATKVSSAKAKSTSSSSTSSATPVSRPTTGVAYLKRPDRTDSEIRNIAREEARRLAEGANKSLPSGSEVRRIAHEEVARYREAERKLEAYPGAFAHGRLVPMSRKSEAKDKQTTRSPPKGSEADVVSATASQAKKVRSPERVSSIRSTSYRSSQSQQPLEQESWGPQWRRELSLERRRSNETKDETWRVDLVDEIKSKVSAPPSSLARSDKPRSTYDVVPETNASVRGSQVPSQVPVSVKEKPREPVRSMPLGEDATMGFLFPPAGHRERREGFDRERETFERLSVKSQPSVAQSARGTNAHASVGSPAVRSESQRKDSPGGRSSTRWDPPGSGSTSSRGAQLGRERGSETHVANAYEKKNSQTGSVSSPIAGKEPLDTRRGSDVEYEYRLHTVRPADQAGDIKSSKKASPRSEKPDHVTLEIWQEVPTDPVQRAREAPLHEQERRDAVDWLRQRVDDPKAKVGVDSDGSVRLACSIPHRSAGIPPPREDRRPSPQRASRQPSPQWQERATRREEESRSHRSSGHRGGGGSSPRHRSPARHLDRPSEQSHKHRDDRRRASASPEKDVVVEVWEQVPSKEAARIRREAADGKETVIEAWKQVPSDRPAASSTRRDSVMEQPPARRRRERREMHRPSEDSAHVKFASKIEISPTPPGSDESSNAFRRFHDFMGRNTVRQQIDGHYSDERGEDLIAEYERRGRLRSREPARRESEQAYDSRGSKDRDATVRPREGQRRYDGRRDDGWRPLQRALSESPSRERDDRKRSSVKGGPPYHPEWKPSGSMTTRDGSRSEGRGSGSRWW